MRFFKGDVVVGLKSANNHYSKTKYNTQWLVYDIEGKNLLLGQVLSPERYVEFQNEYEVYAKTHNVDLFALTNYKYDMFWVEAEHFKLVHRRVINSNSDAVKLLEGVN
jgi:hypothetical protein